MNAQRFAKYFFQGFSLVNFGVAFGGLYLLLTHMSDVQTFDFAKHQGIAGIIIMAGGMLIALLFSGNLRD